MAASVSIMLVAAAVGARDSAGIQSAKAQITSFWPASGSYYAGGTATSALRFKNTSTRRMTFWVDYSVQDPLGRWYDVPSHSVVVGPGQISEVQRKAWTVPTDSLLTTGLYNVRMSVWKGRPENGNAIRLASVGEANAFRAFNFRDEFTAFDAARWIVPDRDLGRSHLDPANVDASDGSLRIKIPAGTLEGGAIQSASLYRYGGYSARIKVPDAPSSITGFFLYDAPDYESEIDVEIYNDDSRRIIFSTYAAHYSAGGALLSEPTHTVHRTLPFDPRAGFHDYTFVLYPGLVSFYADGWLMQSWSGGLPTSPMNLWINTWFPTWLPGERPKTDRYTYVDLVRH